MDSHALRPAEKQDPRIGVVLQDRYRIVRKLGEGGMGAVYEAEHVLIKRRLAIKVLHAQFAENEEIVARFQREAEAATSIGHPNIIEVTDMGRFPDGTAYMVLEFLEGRDWSRDIKIEGPQPIGKIVHILSQVCDALAAAHAKGIVHRDLKPENVYLIQRPNDPCFAKVLDFGISKFADASKQDRSLTQTGTALGTPYYMAPEQCQGKKDIDPRADIYSIGVILFQALTGQYPFDDESYPMLVLKICTEPPPRVTHYRPDVPAELQHVVERMLAKRREDRFQSCAEVKAALQPFAQLHAAPVLATDAPRTSARGPSVLERASDPGAAHTPSGTAYLPGTPVPASVASAATATGGRSSLSGLLIVALGLLGLLVVLGGTLGTAVALGWIGAGSVGGEGGGGASDGASDGDRAPPIVAAGPTGAPAAAEAPAAASDAPAELEPEATEPVVARPDAVHVTIRATPAEATIELDGRTFRNPFEADVPRGAHHLVVRAEGYVTSDEEVEFDLDNFIYTVELQPEGGAEDRSGEQPERPRTRRSRVTRQRTSSPQPRPLGGGSSAGGSRPAPSSRGGNGDLIGRNRLFGR